MCQAGSRNTRSQVRVSVPRQQSLYPPSVKTILLASIIAVAGLWPVQDAPVPVEEAPDHKTVFKNEYVQAFRVTLQPGQATVTHTHSRNDVAVRLSNATVAQQPLGEPLRPAETAEPGGVSARDNESRSFTHRVLNVGHTVFDVIDVQILSRPPGDPTEALVPPAAENPKMRGYRYELAPGASTALHTHARPYVIVAATDMDLRTVEPDGSSIDHSVKAGDLHWVDSRVTHVLTNRGTQKGVLVEIELK